MVTQPELVTEEQICNALSVALEQLRKWVANPDLGFPPSVGTNPLVWERAAVEAWALEKRRKMGM
jgi:hypothetical protein